MLAGTWVELLVSFLAQLKQFSLQLSSQQLALLAILRNTLY